MSLDLSLALAPGEIDRLGALFGPPIRMERYRARIDFCRRFGPEDPVPGRSPYESPRAGRGPRGPWTQVARGEIGGRRAAAFGQPRNTRRRASKRQKDLADIARLLENHPELRELVRARDPRAADRIARGWQLDRTPYRSRQDKIEPPGKRSAPGLLHAHGQALVEEPSWAFSGSPRKKSWVVSRECRAPGPSRGRGACGGTRTAGSPWASPSRRGSGPPGR